MIGSSPLYQTSRYTLPLTPGMQVGGSAYLAVNPLNTRIVLFVKALFVILAILLLIFFVLYALETSQLRERPETPQRREAPPSPPLKGDKEIELAQIAFAESSIEKAHTELNEQQKACLVEALEEEDPRLFNNLAALLILEALRSKETPDFIPATLIGQISDTVVTLKSLDEAGQIEVMKRLVMRELETSEMSGSLVIVEKEKEIEVCVTKIHGIGQQALQKGFYEFMAPMKSFLHQENAA